MAPGGSIDPPAVRERPDAGDDGAHEFDLEKGGANGARRLRLSEVWL